MENMVVTCYWLSFPQRNLDGMDAHVQRHTVGMYPLKQDLFIISSGWVCFSSYDVDLCHGVGLLDIVRGIWCWPVCSAAFLPGV